MEMEERGRRRSMRRFGEDILLRIFSRLPLSSLAHCSAVCKFWNKIIESSFLLWREVYKKRHKTLKATLGSSLMREITKLASPTPNLEEEGDWKSRAMEEEQCARLLYGSITIEPWKAHKGRANCCRMMMDEIATGSSDQKIRIWSSKSKRCLEEYSVPINVPIIDLDFDTDKIIGIAGREVYIWRRKGKRGLLRQMGGHNQRLYSMCHMDPEVAVGCEDGSIRIFDLYSGGCSMIVRQHTEAVTSIGMNVDLHLFASCSRDGTVKLCDSLSGEKVASLSTRSSPAEANCLQVVSDDSNKLLVGTAAGNIHGWDMRMHQFLWTLKVSTCAITCVHHQPYGASILGVGGLDGVIRLVDYASGRNLGAFGCRKDILVSQAKMARKEGSTSMNNGALASHFSKAARKLPVEGIATVDGYLSPQQADRLSDGLALESVTRNDPPLLSLWLGMSKLVSSHTDGSVALWKFGLSSDSSV